MKNDRHKRLTHADRSRRRHSLRESPCRPTLRFTPTAWAKLLFLRDYGDSEIGGFAICAADDLLLVEDVCLVAQCASRASVAFEDRSVADFFDRQVDLGRRPEQFARVWAHTHPGGCPRPSGTDEETFHRVFGGCDWAVMFILARGGQSYARLRFTKGPGADMEIPVTVDYSRSFTGSEHEQWEGEYHSNVKIADGPCGFKQSALTPELAELSPSKRHSPRSRRVRKEW
ncbi:MAG: Mov34/MPN/PAD-1 family protein [Planctomycetales bacterium]|nr:Mov34/MPN/PAD-1 family protein [Planctomycetales bacterium]